MVYCYAFILSDVRSAYALEKMPFRAFPSEVSVGGFSASFSPLPAEYGGGGFWKWLFSRRSRAVEAFLAVGIGFGSSAGVFVALWACYGFLKWNNFYSGKGLRPFFFSPARKHYPMQWE